MNAIIYETPYLEHHGVLGQKWGVRRYQNDDGSLTPEGKKHLKELESDFKNEDIVLKKNTTFNRVGSSNEQDNNKRTYVSYTNDDKYRYINYSDTLRAYSKMELKSISSMKVAKGKSAINAFSDMLQQYTPEEFVDAFCPKRYTTVKKLFSTYQKESEWSKRERAEAFNVYDNALNNKDSFKKAYKRFSMDLMADTKISDSYYQNLAKKGYQAVFDYNDKNAADNPLIVFNRGKSLKTTSISDITALDIDNATEYLRKKGIW